MRLLDYYMNVLTTTGLILDNDNRLSLDGVKPITYETLPVVLPTADHMGSIKTLDKKSMEMVTSKILFNPLSESEVYGIAPSMTILKNKIDMSIEMSLEYLFKYLLQLIVNPELQSNVSMNIMRFFETLSGNYTKKVKTLYGKDTEKNLNNLFSNKDIKLIFSKMDKDVKVNGKNYKYVLNITKPLLETITSTSSMRLINKNKSIKGCNVTPTKDLPIIRSMYEYVFDDVKTTYTTNSISSPTFRLYMEYWLEVYGRINDLLKELRHLDEESIDIMLVEMSITKKEITANYIKRFSDELSTIPTDNNKTQLLTPIRKKKKKVTIPHIEVNRELDLDKHENIHIQPNVQTVGDGKISQAEFLERLKNNTQPVVKNPNQVNVVPTQPNVMYGTPICHPTTPTPSYGQVQQPYGNGTVVSNPYGVKTTQPYGQVQQPYGQVQQSYPQQVQYGRPTVSTPYPQTQAQKTIQFI